MYATHNGTDISVKFKYSYITRIFGILLVECKTWQTTAYEVRQHFDYTRGIQMHILNSTNVFVCFFFHCTFKMQ